MNRERAAADKERSDTAQRSSLDWEAAHVFLEIAQAGSFRAAADRLGQSVNALRRRFEKLEHKIGATLLTRHVDGVRLTAEGERVLAAARAMEAAAFELVRGHNLDAAALSGEVKIAITDGLGAFWVVPHLASCRQRYPDLMVNLHCEMSPADVLRLEADIAVQLTRPTAKDLKLKKLGRLHGTPFASKSYIAARGNPHTYADLMDHQVVWQDADQVTPWEEFPPALQAVLRKGRSVMRTNSSAAHFSAIVNGLGIGVLPTYAQTLSDQLVPVHVNFRTQHDIWLVYHPDAGRIPRVQAVIDWLVEIFAPHENPWFNDKLLHPDTVVSPAAAVLRAKAG